MPFYTEGIAETIAISKTSTNVLKNIDIITFTGAYHRFFSLSTQFFNFFFPHYIRLLVGIRPPWGKKRKSAFQKYSTAL